MAEVTVQVAVPPSRVWETLADGWLYSAWVVGTSKIRAVDSDFPAPGTKIYHAVGLWPVLLEDETEVLESRPEQRLVLQARAWPMGEATVTLELVPTADGTAVRMIETPTKGPASWVNNPVAEKMLRHRMAECLNRLVPLVEGHCS